MTTATTSVVKEDLTTPADPFDMGAGRVDLTKAGDPRPHLRRDRPRAWRRSATTRSQAVELNVAVGERCRSCRARSPSVRTATNVTDQPFSFNVSTTAPSRLDDQGVAGLGAGSARVRARRSR